MVHSIFHGYMMSLNFKFAQFNMTVISLYLNQGTERVI
jgi:hypothetical protein